MELEIQGKKVPVREVDFEIEKEEWNSYKLVDGGIVRIKTTVLRIFQILDELGNPKFDVNNIPLISVQSKNEVVMRY